MSRDELLDPSLRERVAAEYERFCEAFDNAARDRSAMNCRELALRALVQLTIFGVRAQPVAEDEHALDLMKDLRHGGLYQRMEEVGRQRLAAVMVRVGFLFTAIAVPSLFVTIVKRIIGRARPNVGGSLDPFLFDPFKWTAAYAGMPSGHATTAFAVLVAFGTLWPRARTALLIYAVLIAISRVVVTAHYPTDVLAGALVGAVGAMMVRRYFALRRLGFSIGPGGDVHQLPGPSLRRIKAVARGLLAP